MNLASHRNFPWTIGLSVGFLILLLLSPAPAADSSAPWLFQKPALSRTHIVFVFAGDLWSVPREGRASPDVEPGI